MGKAFKNWQKKRCVKTMGYLTNMGAHKAGEKEGFRAALEWVLKTAEELEDAPIFMQDVIKQELEEN